MEKICKNCKWWERFTAREKNVTFSYHYGQCNHPIIIRGQDESENTPMGGIMAYEYEFETDEYFGCIHFEPEKKRKDDEAKKIV